MYCLSGPPFWFKFCASHRNLKLLKLFVWIRLTWPYSLLVISSAMNIIFNQGILINFGSRSLISISLLVLLLYLIYLLFLSRWIFVISLWDWISFHMVLSLPMQWDSISNDVKTLCVINEGLEIRHWARIYPFLHISQCIWQDHL